MSDDTTHYENNFEHCVRPSSPRERRDADRVLLQDYEALYLLPGLRELGWYADDTKVEADIARAYVEYIQTQVREMEHGNIYLYAHTPEAKDVLIDAVFAVPSGLRELQPAIAERVYQAFASSE